MTNRSAETSPLIYARVAGILAILLVVLGPFSLMLEKGEELARRNFFYVGGPE